MYRPEGWENPYGAASITEEIQVEDILSGSHWEKNQIFEEGADAMLEGLKKKSLIIENKSANFYENRIYLQPEGKGWLVFIPEE